MHLKISITDQLALTCFEPQDKENLLLYLNDPVLYQNTLRIPRPYTGEDADEWLLNVENTRKEFGMETNWAVRHSTAGLIGGIGRFVKSGVNGHCDEIGYWLAAPYRGQGYMSKVVAVYCDWLFENTPLIRIEAGVFAHNPASVRVLEKAGFEQEGYARKKHLKDGILVDTILMAKLKDGGR